MINKMTEKKENETKQEKSIIEVVQITTETKAGFQLPDGEVVTQEMFLAWLGEQVYQIRKSVE